MNRLLSIKIEQYKFLKKEKKEKWDGLIHFFSLSGGTFPTGLLSRVTEFLDNQRTPWTVIDSTPRLTTNDFSLIRNSLKDVELREMQVDAVKNAVLQTRGILYCATNFGKTEVALAIHKYLAQNSITKLPRTLILTHRKEICSQTTQRIIDRLEICPTTIHGGKIYWGDPSISVGMVPTIASILSKKGIDRDAEEREILQFIKTADILFLDECHLASSTSWYKVASHCNAFFRYGLSGTPFVKDVIRDIRLEAMTGPVIFTVKNEDMIEGGFSAEPVIHLQEYTSPQYSKLDYQEQYDKYITKYSVRNIAIVRNIIKMVKKEQRRTLVLIQHIEHGNILCNLLQSALPDYRIEFIHGSTEDRIRKTVLNDFKLGHISVLVASSILREGVDIKNVECLVLAGGGKAETSVLQSIGRVLRKSDNPRPVIVYDYVDCIGDKNGNYLFNHFEERCQIYLKEKFQVQIKHE